jgi:hypothetical protein
MIDLKINKKRFVKTLVFWLLALALGLTLYIGANPSEGAEFRLLESDVLIGTSFILPLLVVGLFPASIKSVLFKLFAISCLGIWIAYNIYPVEQQVIIPQLIWLRYMGLVILTLLEVKLVVIIFKAIFNDRVKEIDAKTLQEEHEMPERVAKILAWETNMWKKVFGLFRKR